MIKYHKQNLYQYSVIYNLQKPRWHNRKISMVALVHLALLPTRQLIGLIGVSTYFMDGSVSSLHGPVAYSLHDSMRKACDPNDDLTRRQPIWRLLLIPNCCHGTVAAATTAYMPPRGSAIMSWRSLRATTIIDHRFPIQRLVVVASVV
jgi:hypothetical protein